MSPAINKGIRVVHRWVGLTVGLVIVMMALTGSVNLFRAPLEPVINRDPLTVETCAERVPLDVLAANARAVHAAAELDYVRIIAGSDGAERMPATRIRFLRQRESAYKSAAGPHPSRPAEARGPAYCPAYTIRRTSPLRQQ